MKMFKIITASVMSTMVLAGSAMAYIPANEHPELSPSRSQAEMRAEADRNPIIDIIVSSVAATDAGGAPLPGMVEETTTVHKSRHAPVPATGAALR